MPPVRFEPTISAGERPQTYALDRAAPGTGSNKSYHFQYNLNCTFNKGSCHEFHTNRRVSFKVGWGDKVWAVTWRLEEYYTWQRGGIEPHAICRINKAANMTACVTNVLCVSYFIKQ